MSFVDFGTSSRRLSQSVTSSLLATTLVATISINFVAATLFVCLSVLTTLFLAAWKMHYLHNAICKMQFAKCDLQDAVCKMQFARYNLQDATWKMQVARCFYSRFSALKFLQ